MSEGLPGWARPLLDRRRVVSAGVVALAGLSALVTVRAPLRIGVVGDLAADDAARSEHGAVLAATMALEDFGGRVLGRPIQILAGDTGGDQAGAPAAAVALVDDWFDRGRVATVIGGGDAGPALQAMARRRGALFLATHPPLAALDQAQCGPTLFQFMPPIRARARAALADAMAAGAKTWLVLGGDGQSDRSLPDMAAALVAVLGGTVLAASDRASPAPRDAEGVLFASAGAALVDGVRRARQAGLAAGRELVAMSVEPADLDALGGEAAGLRFATAFYPDMSANAHSWSRRFLARHGGRAPSGAQAMTYSATLAYLQAVQAAGTDDAAEVAARLHREIVRDVLIRGAPVRPDGRVACDLFVVRVRGPDAGGDKLQRFEKLATARADQQELPAPGLACA